MPWKSVPRLNLLFKKRRLVAWLHVICMVRESMRMLQKVLRLEPETKV
jgi:Mg2+ and Co2+ transporter CorA